ncbi:hypothetical protein A0H81_08790 [Grifola frondosa]|uniref:DUF4436 domain-containing protein n=1 Tax=Grifola frondosa TaxID=5627 RepID=A0A1C7M2S8_GRIFR|nr:hypothetical protein A0H81_08790 [Grifola frondosa]
MSGRGLRDFRHPVRPQATSTRTPRTIPSNRMASRLSFLSTISLIRTPSIAESVAASTHAPTGSTQSGRQPRSGEIKLLASRAGMVPLRPTFIISIVAMLSILFIVSISCAFIGAQDEKSSFASLLDEVASETPGIVLLGDDVDVDIDEPSVTIRCSCGMPAMPLNIFVDSAQHPAAMYNPSQFPFVSGTGQRRSIQNLIQFDSDHVLDVHEARLYPFDTYRLTSTLRAESTNNQSVPIQKLCTLKVTSSFVISPTDIDSYSLDSNGTQQPTRDIDLLVSRPTEARSFALLLFGVNWMLAHTTVGLVTLAWNVDGAEKILQYLLLAFIILLVIPQLRNAMPDAPGFDGVLVDSIGFFPQMLVSGAAAIALLTMMGKRELQRPDNHVPPEEKQETESGTISKGLERMRRQTRNVY